MKLSDSKFEKIIYSGLSYIISERILPLDSYYISIMSVVSIEKDPVPQYIRIYFTNPVPTLLQLPNIKRRTRDKIKRILGKSLIGIEFNKGDKDFSIILTDVEHKNEWTRIK